MKNINRPAFKKNNLEICHKCLLEGIDLDIHHILPIQHGGNNEFDNLIFLCSYCHKEYHSIYKDKNINQETLNIFLNYESTFDKYMICRMTDYFNNEILNDKKINAEQKIEIYKNLMMVINLRKVMAKSYIKEYYNELHEVNT